MRAHLARPFVLPLRQPTPRDVDECDRVFV
jgi:hypothetical protein